jgi:hypothetical protein
MTACFYDQRGWMLGRDKHLFLKRGPGWFAVIGVPEPDDTHIVAAPNSWASNGRHTSNVTSGGNLMLMGEHSLECVPHVPVDLLEGAVLETPLLAWIIANSESEPFLKKANVHGNGAPLACCLFAVLGLNLNCEGLGAVINPNSVVTTPTIGDFASAVFSWAANAAVDWAIGKFVEKVTPFDVPIDKDGELKPVKEVVMYIYDKFVKPYTVDPVVESLTEDVRSYADSL